MKSTTSIESRESLEFITAAYLAQRMRGLEPDHDELLRTYPEYAERLRAFLQHCDMFRLAADPVPPLPLRQDSTDAGQRSLFDASSHCGSHLPTPWNDRTYQALRGIVLDPSNQDMLEDLQGLDEETRLQPRTNDPIQFSSNVADGQGRMRLEGTRDAPADAGPRFDALDCPTDLVCVGGEGSLPKSQWIGPYKLLHKIADGGMGSVWMAQQESPIRRRVAIKIIRPELDCRQIFARFDAERQALAMMNHPNIAQVLDAGTSEDGRPYFAMELVQGIPLTSYCDGHELTIRQRLELFLPVCHAIQHAHQKGIIHRDLKPSNILVTLYDGQAVPKVVDFGLAKALDHRSQLTEQTLYTEFGQVVGTLQYMSPEQAEMNSLDIDTRSDIYSLGVLMYELLTGTTPIERKSIDKNAMLQVLQSIRETDPPRPSLRLSESADAIDGISLQRKTEPRRLHQLVRGDLDWIVMKALDKDRARRYPTAVSMAEDIERYLNSQPIVARPPSASYLIGKFFVKHRNACFAGIAMVTLLLFGLVGTSVGLWRAEKERKDAQEAKLLADQAKHFAIQSGMREGQQRIEAEKNAARALTAEKMAEDRADDLQRFVELQSLQLASINVNQMAQQLEASLAKQLGNEGDSKTDSQAKAELDQLALQLKQLNYVDVSRSVLQESVFDPYINTIEAKYLDQPELAISALSAIGQLENDLGLHQASLRPVRLAVELAQKKMGHDHPTTLRLMSELALFLSAAGVRQDSETLCRDVLARRRKVLGETHLDTLHSMNNLAGLLLERGELDEAEKLFSETLAARKKSLGDDHADTIMSLNNMGGMMQMRGKFAEAETYYRPALEARRRLLGSEHYETLMSINNLGFVARKQSRWAEAEQLFREGMETSRRVLGNEHPMTAYFASNMGFLLRDQKRLQDAEPYFREAFELRKRVLGETHPDTIIAMNNLASLYESLERFEQAESLYRTALQVALERTGEGHPNTITYQQNLAALFLKQDKWEEGYRLLTAAYQARVKLAGEFDLQAVELLVGLVSIDRKLDRESDFTAKVLGVVEHFAGEEDNPAIDRLRKYAR